MIKKDNLTDNDLITKVKNENCNNSFIELLKRNEKIYFQVCASYCRKVPKIKYSDMVSDAPFVLNEALKTFKLDKKTKFSTWVYQFSRFYILKQITNKNKEPNFVDTEVDFDILNLKNKCFHFDKSEDFSNYIKNLLNQLKDDRIKKLFEYRYFSDGDDFQWNKISKKIGLSTMGCLLLHERGLKILKQKVNSKVFADKI